MGLFGKIVKTGRVAELAPPAPADAVAMLTVCGHTRDDYPTADPDWGRINIIVDTDGDGRMHLKHQPLPQIPADLCTLLDEPTR